MHYRRHDVVGATRSACCHSMIGILPRCQPNSRLGKIPTSKYPRYGPRNRLTGVD